MTSVAELDTPAVTVDLDIMRDNIRRVQAHLGRHGIGNRPHIKTHKIPAIGRMQMDAGAIGITCQKIGEVEVFVDAGVADDVLLTYNILGRQKTDRLMALFGVSQTSNLLSRYAAADVSPGGQRGRAMGFIVWGSSAGSLIGPNLMEPALRLGRSFGLEPTASAFLISVGGYVVAALLVELFLRPDPLAVARELHESVAVGHASGPARALGEILSDVRVQLALATLTISQFVMISTTSTSPVYLHDQGHTVQTIGVAVSLHLGGMYVASPLSGWLCDRLGRLPMIGVGALVLIGAVLLAGLAPGSDRALVILGLFLNGVGWNFAFVAGSALLTDALSPAERASTQGIADLFMISNVQILRATPSGSTTPSEVTVRCRFLVYRNRVETETDVLVGKREDVLRRVDGAWRIARRMVVLDQSVLLAKNLTFFI